MTRLFRDGFQVSELDSKAKKDLVICNLFVNHQFTIPQIIFALQENYRDVVQVLIDKKAIVDRRHQQRPLPEGSDRRRSALS